MTVQAVPTVRAALIALIAAGIVTSWPAIGQQPDATAKKKKTRTVNPALVPVQEEPGLPRILLIGDSISMGYTLEVRDLLKGKANVVRPRVNCGPTSRGIESLEEWLGDKPWDVIHFNFGLHDIVFYTADGKARAEPTAPGARHQVPIDLYEKNLRQMVERMKKTGATLIWCSTTPVPEGSAGRVADESVEYNAVAARVMREHGIAINDLHAFALPKLAQIQLPQNVHFTAEGSRVLAGQVARSIEAALRVRAGGSVR